MTPRRVQLSRAKGWRMPPDTVKVDRTTRWGNPWRVGEPGIPDAAEAVRMFKARFVGPLASRAHPDSYIGRIAAEIEQLTGKHLACWCKPGEPCHADVLLELANPTPEDPAR